MNDQHKSRGTVAIGSGATGDDPPPGDPEETPTVFEVAPFGQHPPADNAPGSGQSAMPGVAAPYVPPAPEASAARAGVVASPPQRPRAPFPAGPPDASAPNRPPVVGVTPMAQVPSLDPPASLPPADGRDAELFSGSGESLYEFGGTQTGPEGPGQMGGPGADDTFGGAPGLDLAIDEGPHQTNLSRGGGLWIFLVLAIVVGGGATGFLLLGGDNAEADEPDKTEAAAADDDPGADAAPAKETTDPGALTEAAANANANPDPASPPAGAGGGTPADPAQAKAEAPPAVTPDVPKKPSTAPKKPHSSSKPSAKKKGTSSGGLTPSKPPREPSAKPAAKKKKKKKKKKDPFKGLPTPPG